MIRRVRALVAVAALFGAPAFAAAQDTSAAASKSGPGPVPTARVFSPRAPGQERPVLLPRIPEQFSPPQEVYASFPDSGPGTAPLAAKPSACQLRLAKLAAFRPLPMLAGAGECGAVDAVLLESIVLADQAKVIVTPPATLRCSMAEEFANWVRDDVAPAALKLGSPLRGLDNFDSYECRGRNRVLGATLSEHGRANAIDVRAFNLANGQSFGLTDVNVSKGWRDDLRASACAHFSTVLGPGSDGHHEEHIHVDLADRRNGYKTCEWDVREPVKQSEAKQTEKTEQQTGAAAVISEVVPLPRPRPLAANRIDDAKSKKARGQRTQL
jgi:hypothetical protein